MTKEQKIASLFAMDDETWEKHANPWSVWTRNTVLPVLVIAFWSRVWLGWLAIVPVAVAILWMWINPRLFKKPKSTDDWASKSVLGEMIWLNRKAVLVPERHRRAPNILSAVSGTGFLFVIYGVYFLEIWPVLFGSALVYLGKLWFLDRMVWLYEDTKED
ncbi:DUF6653 family protein [Methanolacinia paynteri]|uniref:DUF6653 family protein n=1 Tax=Methanolacinia paynteri TaxID=230356 RepID=UPI00064E9120|nr:DUF6653 family protein [Methanolacinia paynteri]